MTIEEEYYERVARLASMLKSWWMLSMYSNQSLSKTGINEVVHTIEFVAAKWRNGNRIPE